MWRTQHNCCKTPPLSLRFNTGRRVVMPFLRNSASTRDLLVKSCDNDQSAGYRVAVDIPTPVIRQRCRTCNGTSRADCLDGSPGTGTASVSGLPPVECHEPPPIIALCGAPQCAQLPCCWSGDIEGALNGPGATPGAGFLLGCARGAHHGSKTLQRGFLSGRFSGYRNIPVGYRNRFNLPNQDIIPFRGIRDRCWHGGERRDPDPSVPGRTQ